MVVVVVSMSKMPSWGALFGECGVSERMGEWVEWVEWVVDEGKSGKTRRGGEEEGKEDLGGGGEI